MHKQLLKRKYDEHTKPDNGTNSEKNRKSALICIILDSARLMDSVSLKFLFLGSKNVLKKV